MGPNHNLKITQPLKYGIAKLDWQRVIVLRTTVSRHLLDDFIPKYSTKPRCEGAGGLRVRTLVLWVLVRKWMFLPQIWIGFCQKWIGSREIWRYLPFKMGVFLQVTPLSDSLDPCSTPKHSIRCFVLFPFDIPDMDPVLGPHGGFDMFRPIPPAQKWLAWSSSSKGYGYGNPWVDGSEWWIWLMVGRSSNELLWGLGGGPDPRDFILPGCGKKHLNGCVFAWASLDETLPFRSQIFRTTSVYFACSSFPKTPSIASSSNHVPSISICLVCFWPILSVVYPLVI